MCNLPPQLWKAVLSSRYSGLSPLVLCHWHAECVEHGKHSSQYVSSIYSLLHICADMRCDLCIAYKLSLLQEYFAVGGSLGSSRAVAAFRGVVAVGTSSGVVGVLMPRGLSADGHPSGQARVVQLGDARPEDNAVSSMAFSLQASHHQQRSVYTTY